MNTEMISYQEACDEWTRKYEGMVGSADNFHRSLNFSEAEALSGVLAATGRYDLAYSLMQEWAEGDEDSDIDHGEELTALLGYYRQKMRQTERCPHCGDMTPTADDNLAEHISEYHAERSG